MSQLTSKTQVALNLIRESLVQDSEDNLTDLKIELEKLIQTIQDIQQIYTEINF